MHDFASQFLRFVLKLVLGVFALLFAVSLIAAALIVLAWTLLKALLTGKKPAPAMVFGRFQRFSPQGTEGSGQALRRPKPKLQMWWTSRRAKSGTKSSSADPTAPKSPRNCA